jgi:ABC-2 type transport system ATP-binding protein
VIEVTDLTKRFGARVAVDNLSFSASPGRVTGFLGPNGSGKSTTMRCMLGLDRPQAGFTRFSGRRFTEIVRPLTEIAALLDAGYVHPGRSGRDHLRWLAASNGLGMNRVDDVLQMVGMTQVAKQKVRGYSLGMRQRLGLAGVLLGDPHTVILDEPGNGLDPEGIKWVRDVLGYLAGDGRTVLVSSHLLSEMQLMAHDLVVIGQGLDHCAPARRSRGAGGGSGCSTRCRPPRAEHADRLAGGGVPSRHCACRRVPRPGTAWTHASNGSSPASP